MKLLHMSDLHLGRRLNEFSLLEDQRHILQQIVQIAKDEKPDAVLLAGDIYDKQQPSAEAVELLDAFLTALIEQKRPVFLISGNHDSPERLGFAGRILQKNGLHIAGVFDGNLYSQTLNDAWGPVHIYMLPYVKPVLVRPYFQQAISTHDQAVRAVLEAASVDDSQRNVLIAHQFVTSGGWEPERSESEALSIGGLDHVDSSAFYAFDYVALGHLHGPQRIGRDSVRYAGSPLKYSFSETHQRKSVTLVEIGEKGQEPEIRQIPLQPLRDLRVVKGNLKDLLEMGSQTPTKDYIRAVLTDEEELYDAIGHMRSVYPNLMQLDFENSRTADSEVSIEEIEKVTKKSPLELFSKLYAMQNHNELSEEEEVILRTVLEQVGGAQL